MKTTLQIVMPVSALLFLFLLLSCSPPPAPTGGAVNYFCSGQIPEQARLCAVDDENVTKTTPITLVHACTVGTKCEATCRPGYQKVGDICWSAPGKCLGGVPRNAELCGDDDIFVSETVLRAVVPICTAERKCEYLCQAGYTLTGNQCLRKLLPAGKCFGPYPQNAELCDDDNIGLTVNTRRTIVSACDEAKCEYTCKPGYVQSGNACRRATGR